MKHKIELSYWTYSCADGCCYETGTTLKLNGEELTNYAESNLADSIEMLLVSLGIDAEVTIKEEE